MKKKLIALFFLLLGISIFYIAIIPILKNLEAQLFWSKVDAKVKESKIKYITKRIQNRNYEEWDVSILYEYTVNKISYTSTNAYFKSVFADTSGFDTAKEFKNLYPPNKHVEVYYNPDNPNESVLALWILDAGFYIPFFIGFIITIISMRMLYLYFFPYQSTINTQEALEDWKNKNSDLIKKIEAWENNK